MTEILRFGLLERTEQVREPRTESGGIERPYRGQDGRSSGPEPPVAIEHPRREVTELTYFVRDGRAQLIEQARQGPSLSQLEPHEGRSAVG